MIHIKVDLEDSLRLSDNKIIALVNNQEFVYPVEMVEKIVILTTDMGPFFDDMCLAIDVGNDTAIFIMSEHKCYSTFLFDQIGKILPIDFQKVIDASMCIENNVFEIYRKSEFKS